MSGAAAAGPPSAIYVRRQKILEKNTACAAQEIETSSGVGVGMNSPTMQRIERSFISKSSSFRSAAKISQPPVCGDTRRVSFDAVLDEKSVRYKIVDPDNATELDHSIAVKKNSGDHPCAPINSPNFFKEFSTATQREIDVCVQFALHGGPLIKFSSRAHKAPMLCNFRLTKDLVRLVWADALKPEIEKYGLEIDSLQEIVFDDAVENEARAFKRPEENAQNLKMTLLLSGNEMLRLQALDKVSFRYWSFALLHISKKRKVPQLEISVGEIGVIPNPDLGSQGVQKSVSNFKMSAKETYSGYSEKQLTEMRSFFSKARHGRLDALLQMLNDGVVSIDTVDENGNTVLIVAAQNNNKRICKAALRHGANIDHQNRMGQTCLHFAFALGYSSLGEYLVSKGASEALQNKYGLTCRQGLAPHNHMQLDEGSAKSPIHGYVTQRGDRSHLQTQHPSAATQLSIPSRIDCTDDFVNARSSTSAGGFATDRPSPSLHRHRNMLNSPLSTTGKPETSTVVNTPTKQLDLMKPGMHIIHDDSRDSAMLHSSQSKNPENEIDQKSVYTSAFNELSESTSNQSGCRIHSKSGEKPLSLSSPAQKQSAGSNNFKSSLNESFDQSLELSKSDAASHVDSPLKSQFLSKSWQALVQCNPDSVDSSSQRKLQSSYINANFQSDLNFSSGISSDDELVGQQNCTDECKKLDCHLTTISTSSAGFIDKNTVNIPENASTAPITLLRNSSSNSSGGSTNGVASERTNQSLCTEQSKLDPSFFVDGITGAIQRQKLRSGNVGALRPSTAGTTRKAVRPDLASGLGFKSIEVTSRKSIDHVRIPPRPSTPVLARHASTEEDYSLLGSIQPCNQGSKAVKNSEQFLLQTNQQMSPLSTARVAWGSPEK